MTPPCPEARGLLLVHAEPRSAVAWAGRGLVSVDVADLGGGWTAVVPASALAGSAAPYDDPVAMLLGRAVPRRLCGAIGVAQVGPRLVLSVVPGVWRPRTRWLVWAPGEGLIRVGALRPATVADLAAAAGRRESGPALAAVLRERRGSALDVATDVFEILALPGLRLALGQQPAAQLPGVQRVQTHPREVRRFDRLAREDIQWRAEVERRS